MTQTRAVRARTQAGFTLIELMVVIAVAAVLLAIAVPSFRSLTQINRAAGEVNALSNDLQFARAEAIKEGLPVSICVSTNGTSCASSNTWQSGWIVFSDNTNLTGTSPPTATGITPLRRQLAWSSSDTLVATKVGTTTTVPSVTFNRDGFAINLGGTVQWALTAVPANSSAGRCVKLNLVGHQSVQGQPC